VDPQDDDPPLGLIAAAVVITFLKLIASMLIVGILLEFLYWIFD
jgi:hypothetical protein